MPFNKQGFYDTGYYNTKDTSMLPIGSYSLPQPPPRNVTQSRSQPSYAPSRSVTQSSTPIDASTLIASVRSILAGMKSDSRDLDYEDYLWRLKQKEQAAEKARMFRAYGGS